MIKVVSSTAVKILSLGNAQAMAIWPFILVSDRSLLQKTQLMRHESIHLRQQLELGIIPFYIWYLLDYMAGRLQGMSHSDAYLNIRFEKEAYANDAIENYLTERKTYNFLSF